MESVKQENFKRFAQDYTNRNHSIEDPTKPFALRINSYKIESQSSLGPQSTKIARGAPQNNNLVVEMFETEVEEDKF